MVLTIKNKEIALFSTPTDLFQCAANDFSERANTAVQEKGCFSVVLSGGNTPKQFFDTLTDTEQLKKDIPWQRIQFFFGDERYVPSTDTNNNYYMACEHLFSKVAVRPENIYSIPTTFIDPKDAAIEYEKTVRKALHVNAETFPPFDLVYLGLGDDAHTASLMPFSDVVQDHLTHTAASDTNTQLVAALFSTAANMYRITLTPNAINHSQAIIFLVTGANKASAVKAVLEGNSNPLHYPAQLIHSRHGKTLWYVEQAAATQLSTSSQN